jgi:hypothetical protein
MWWSTGIILVLVLTRLVLADVPTHCLKWQVLGTWDFKLSAPTTDSPLCSHTRPDDIITVYNAKVGFDNPGFQVEKTGTFQLLSNFSDAARLCVNDLCEDAKWTMVYDEAMSIKGLTSGLELTMHFAYVPRNPSSDGPPNGKEAQFWNSLCDQTYPGWFGKSTTERGCVVAKNRQPIPPHQSVSIMSDDSSSSSSFLQTRLKHALKQTLLQGHKAEFMQARAFDMDQLVETAALINSRQKFWVADASAASFAKDFTNRDIFQAVGGVRDKLLRPKSFSLDDIIDPEARSKEELRRQCVRKVLPDSIDWSNNQFTQTPVANQGSCGSCYAVSSADAFTSRIRLKKQNANIKARSAKGIFQCSVVNQGCDGGFPWLVAYHGHYEGLYSDDCLGPYEASIPPPNVVANKCPPANKSPACSEDVEFVKSWGYVGGYYGKGNTEDMMWSLYRDGPMVVAIDAESDLFLYKSGLFVAKSFKAKHI